MLIVFGGAFNPPTVLHLHIVKKLLSTIEGSQVLILPVGDDYKKPLLIPFHYRIDMLNLLIKGLKNVSVSSLEGNAKFRGTLASLKELSKTNKDISFAIGADNLRSMSTWIRYDELLENYPFIVMTRKNSFSEIEAEKMFENQKHHFTFIQFDESGSSTEVRENKASRKRLLTKRVYRYIVENHLYEE